MEMHTVLDDSWLVIMLKVEENQAVRAADNCNILECNPGQ